jgi:hypothetical protein
VACSNYSTKEKPLGTLPQNVVQQLAESNGTWSVQTTFQFDTKKPDTPPPFALMTAKDGSIWSLLGNEHHSNNVINRIIKTGSGWQLDPNVNLSPNAPENRPNPGYMLAAGPDGSVWVIVQNTRTSKVAEAVNSNGTWALSDKDVIAGAGAVALATGPHDTVWVANLDDNTVQPIANSGGTWTAGTAVDVSRQPDAMTAGLDGSMWVASASGSVQQLLNIRGAWKAGSAIPLAWTLEGPYGTGPAAYAIETSLDGSIWVANNWSNGQIQQLIQPPSMPRELRAVVGPNVGSMTLGWLPPIVNGGASVASYTVTIDQGSTHRTITTTSTSCMVDGLSTDGGDVYFTVTASNFVAAGPAAALWFNSYGEPLSTKDRGVGIVSDGTPFTGGGLDGYGNAYSWQELGASSTMPWNGVTFDLGSVNQPNFTQAAGQTISVPRGSFSSLNLAGTAVNGAQQNQPITLAFTDGSTVIWTQSFSDWGSPQNYGHEAILSTQTYRNTASGGREEFTNRVYGYTYTIPEGKTLASITLPTNVNVSILDIQMANSAAINLSSAYNSWGIANGSTQVANRQGFDGGGYYYYSGNLQSTIAWSGATFVLGPVPDSKKGGNNFVQGKGQLMYLPQGDFGWLYLAGAAANGSQTSQPLTLTFSDGSTATWTQSFSDWCSPSGFSGESIIQMQPNWVNQVGNVHSQTNYVYGYAYRIPAGKTLASITLPKNTNVGILGMAMLP